MRKTRYKLIIILAFIMISFTLLNFSASAESIPDSIKIPVKNSVEDTSWLTETSEQVLKNLNKWYTPGLVEQMWPAIKAFREQQTDWHSTYKVYQFKFCSYQENKVVLKVGILETCPNETERYLIGVFHLKQIQNRWKIDSFNITPQVNLKY